MKRAMLEVKVAEMGTGWLSKFVVERQPPHQTWGALVVKHAYTSRGTL
jgi:hypothetical protein